MMWLVAGGDCMPITFHDNAAMFVSWDNVLFCIICNECCSLIKINWYCEVKILLVLKFFPQILEKRHISILLLHFWWTTWWTQYLKGFCRYNLQEKCVFSQLKHQPQRSFKKSDFMHFFLKHISSYLINSWKLVLLIVKQTVEKLGMAHLNYQLSSYI